MTSVHNRCTATRKDGQPCRVPAVAGTERCFAHSEQTAALRREARRRGGRNSARTVRAARLVPSTLRPVLALLLDTLDDVHGGKLPAAQANAVATVAGAVVKVYQAGLLEERISALEQRAREDAYVR